MFEVDVHKLRWAVGAILAENGEAIDEETRAFYEKEKYKFMTLPAVNTAITCVFPYTTMISIVIAVKRVYPALNNYIAGHQLKANVKLELYFGGVIHYVVPLSNQEKFYKPKALQTQQSAADPDQSAPLSDTPPPADVTIEEAAVPAESPAEPAKAILSPTEDSAAAGEEAEDQEDSDDSFEKLEAEN